MTASPGELFMFGDFDHVAHIPDPRGYCFCCSLDVALWTPNERFKWLMRFRYSAPCKKCPSVASDGSRQTLARRRHEWLRSEAKEHLSEEPEPCRSMPDDPQPCFWTEGVWRGD